MNRVVMVALWAVLVAVSVAGCGDPGPGWHGNPGPERVAELESGLRDRPSFEDAQAQYAQAMQQMARQIAPLVPGITWHVEEDSWTGCAGEYVWTRAIYVYYVIVFDKPIPDDAWPQAVQIVKDGAAQFGATDVRSFVNQPGNKMLAISGSGAEFQFGTAVQTIFSATSDCRMRRADGPRTTTTKPVPHPSVPAVTPTSPASPHR